MRVADDIFAGRLAVVVSSEEMAAEAGRRGWR